jgi:hypothetical protein
VCTHAEGAHTQKDRSVLMAMMLEAAMVEVVMAGVLC